MLIKERSYIKCGDFKFLVRKNSNDFLIIKSICQENCYLKDSRLQILKKDNVVDIGAHIGSFSILAASKGATVYSYEPDLENYELLKINIALNKLENFIKPFNCAIENFSGKSKLYRNIELDNNLYNFGGHSLYSKYRKMAIDVDVLKFSDELEKLPTIDFLKLDCEGAEHPIILMNNLKNINQIAMEYHGNKECLNKLINKLINSNFEIIYQTIVNSLQGTICAIKKSILERL